MSKLLTNVKSDATFINVESFPEELTFDKRKIDKIKYTRLKKMGITMLTQFIEQLEADDLSSCMMMLKFSSGGRDPDADNNFYIDFSLLGVKGVSDVGAFIKKLQYLAR